MSDLVKLTIKETLEGLKNKKFSAVELSKAHLDRIRKENPNLNAFVLVDEAHTLNEAKKSDQRIQAGQMGLIEGIPIAVKDLFCTKGFLSTSCSKILQDFTPAYESTVTSNLYNNGGVMIGKTNMDEFAMGSANVTSALGNVNGPWVSNEGELVTPGGSSGGASASVSAFLAQGALGSDTGGSVRQPASFTGTVGFKPSYGRCSRWGMIAFSSSLDQAGVITRTVDDSAILLQSIMGYDTKDSTSANIALPNLIDACKSIDVKGMKIAIPKEYYEVGVPDEINQMWQEGIEFLKKAGAEVSEVSLPHTKYGLSAYYIIAPAEASSNLARYDGVRYGLKGSDFNSLDELYENTRAQGFGAEVKRRIMIGTYVLSSSNYDSCFLQAQRVRRLIAQDFKNVFEKFDAILTPTCISDAFAVNKQLTPLEMYKNDLFTIPASLAGLPCISIPAKISKRELPLGLQIIGKNFAEETVIKVAKFLESSFGFDIHKWRN